MDKEKISYNMARETSIIQPSSPNSEDIKENSKDSKHIENRLETIGLPTVVLPGKKNINTLNNWVEKKMGEYPETRNGFLAYFDEEAVNKGKVNGYIIEPCDNTKEYNFEFKSKHYKVSSYKFDKIEGIKSTFYDVLLQDNYTKGMNNEIIKILKEKSNKGNPNKKYNKSVFYNRNMKNLFNKYDNMIYENILNASLDNGIIDEEEYLKRINGLSLGESSDENLPKNLKYQDALNMKKLSHKVFNGYFEIRLIDSLEILKQKGSYLYFELNKTTKKSKRVDFNNAILNGDFELAKELYLEALDVTRNKLKRIGLTPEQNKFIINCFRRRDFEGIKKILDETKDIVGENMEVEDTEHKYSEIVDIKSGEEIREYNNNEKKTYKDPMTGNEVLMTRKELHERIIEKFLLEGEASKGKKELILSGGLPGAGKSTIEESLKDVPKVIVNPDLVKDYLPEYYDEHGRKFGAEIVHKESSYISKIIYDRAIKGGYSILYDSSMKDKPTKGFPKYNKIVQSAYKQGYSIEARFIYDGGEARYRNTVIRERSMGLKNYNIYGTAYKTIEYLSKDKRVNKTIIYDNSLNGRVSKAKIIYENQCINIEESDPDLIKKFNNYQLFLDKLL